MAISVRTPLAYIRSVLALWLTLALIGQALAQQPLDLKWKLEKGKTFYQEMTTESKQQLDIAPKKIAQTLKETFVMSFTPLLQDKEKNWVIKQRIEAPGGAD